MVQLISIVLMALVSFLLTGVRASAAGPATTQAAQRGAHQTLVAFATNWQNLQDEAVRQMIAARSPEEAEYADAFARQIRAERVLREAVIKRWGEAQRQFFEEQNLPSVAAQGRQLLRALEQEHVEVDGDGASFEAFGGPQTLQRLEGEWWVILTPPPDADERDATLHNSAALSGIYEDAARRVESGEFADPAAISQWFFQAPSAHPPKTP